MYTQTDTEGKQRKARVRNIQKSSKKNTIFDEHPVGGMEEHDKQYNDQQTTLPTDGPGHNNTFTILVRFRHKLGCSLFKQCMIENALDA